ncbi:hypothetical protein ACEWX4_03100 [Acinetobacter indicus]|uniref:hypothetical protein n=1 Tax=Acinetobacter indicus TaxID=756892 RepID=UPI0035BBBBDE
MTDHSSPEKSPWGWKALIIFSVLGALFLGLFYLAVSNEPDYMPSQQNKHNTQQHAFKNAPAMSEEALAKAQADREAREALKAAPTADAHAMTETEHAAMPESHEQVPAHGH